MHFAQKEVSGQHQSTSPRNAVRVHIPSSQADADFLEVPGTLIMNLHRKIARGFWLIAVGLPCVFMGWPAFPAQSPALEQQIGAISAVEIENQKALSEYSWQEQETISLKGKVESQRLFEVQLGPDGRISRTPMELPEENLSQNEKSSGIQKYVTEKKKRAVMISAKELKELAETYVHFDTESLRRAYERKDIADEPTAAGTGVKKLSIHNFLKAGDLVMMGLTEKSSEVQTLEVFSYLTDPKESVHILAEFVIAPDGLNHVDAITATARKNNLSVVIRNLAYERTVPHVNR
jgi:hypothetical protein